MITNDINRAITEWTTWASTNADGRYDIALLKIWIQFEKFIGELFVSYATGRASEEGFLPTLKLHFSSAEHLNAFLREGNRTYVDYPTQIQRLSKHIFENDPFDVIFVDSTTSTAYNQLVAIRNYIAHESGEAKAKMINKCFSGDEKKFKEPNEFLLTKEKETKQSYYSYYTNIIRNTAALLVNPPQ